MPNAQARALPVAETAVTIVLEAPMPMSRFTALFLFAAVGSFAQGLTFGFVGGVPLTVLLNSRPPTAGYPQGDLTSNITQSHIDIPDKPK